jgi:excisionase family DNA binding protein
MTVPDSKLLTRQEVATALRVHTRTLARWEEKGLIKPLKFSARSIRYRQEDVDRLIEELAS